VVRRGFEPVWSFVRVVGCGYNRSVVTLLRSNTKSELASAPTAGSALVDSPPSRHVKSAQPGLPDELKGRVVEYQHVERKPSRLSETTLEDARFPAPDIVALHRERS